MRYVMQEGVSDADQGTVTSSIQMAESYLGHSMGGQTTRRVIVLVSTTRVCNSEFFATDGLVCIDVGSQGWQQRQPFERTATVAHELFHIIQTDVGCRFQPIWLAEGSAEYFGGLVAAENGLVTFDHLRELHALRIRGEEPLPSLDQSQSISEGRTYSLWFVAVDQLLAGRDPRLLRTYCDNVGKGMAAADAFRETFGLTFEEFYAAFAEYRRTHGV